MTEKTGATTERSDTDRQRNPLARAIQLLSVMVDNGEITYGVRELGTRLDVSASTAHRLLSELEKLGMVSRTPDGTYRLGLELLRLAWTVTAQFPLRESAEDVLRDLTDSSEESSFLGVYNDQRRQMMFTLSIESAHPLRYVLQLHRWLPLHTGASGLAILSFLPESTRSAIVQGHLEAPTEHTIVDADRLDKRFSEIRRNGYAISHGERILGAVAVAAPVFGPAGVVVGDVGITIPESRFDSASEAELATLVMRAASAVTDRVGGSQPAS